MGLPVTKDCCRQRNRITLFLVHWSNLGTRGGWFHTQGRTMTAGGAERYAQVSTQVHTASGTRQQQRPHEDSTQLPTQPREYTPQRHQNDSTNDTRNTKIALMCVRIDRKSHQSTTTSLTKWPLVSVPVSLTYTTLLTTWIAERKKQSKTGV